jgi:hypothetical protein
MSGTLMVDRRARRVDRAALDAVAVPEPEGRWYPIGHREVLGLVTENLGHAGFRVQRQELALSNDDRQFFATLDVSAEIVDGVNLAVGVRNSIDKSLSAAICMGELVLVCSNLAFGGELQIARKHTRFATRDLDRRIAGLVSQVGQYQEVSAARIARLKRRVMAPGPARAMMLRAAEKGIIGWRMLPKVIREWEAPRYPQFEPRTAWSLLNAFTEAIKQRQARLPVAAARQTIRLQQMLAT